VNCGLIRQTIMGQPCIRTVEYAATQAGGREPVAQNETNPKICGYAGLTRLCIERAMAAEKDRGLSGVPSEKENLK